MGDVIPLRNNQEAHEEEQKENKNDFAISLFMEDNKETSENDKLDEQSLIELKKQIRLAKEELSILLNANVDENDTEIFLKWSEDITKAKEHYKELLAKYNEDFGLDNDIEKQIADMERAALFQYTSYSENNAKSEEANEKVEEPKPINNNNIVDVMPLTDTRVTTQPVGNQGNYVQTLPNTPVYININNGKVEQHVDNKKNPNFVRQIIYDVKNVLSNGIRAVIKWSVRLIMAVYSSMFLTLLINKWFGFELPLWLNKYLELIPLYDETVQIIDLILGQVRS